MRVLTSTPIPPVLPPPVKFAFSDMLRREGVYKPVGMEHLRLVVFKTGDYTSVLTFYPNGDQYGNKHVHATNHERWRTGKDRNAWFIQTNEQVIFDLVRA